MKRILSLTSFASLALLTMSAHAVVLNPGDSANLSGTSSAFLAGSTFVADTGFQSFSGTDSLNNVIFTGVYRVAVFQLADNTLSFEFVFRSDDTSDQSISNATMHGFTGWATDVDFVTDFGGDVSPESASRSGSGDDVAFHFTSTSGFVNPGQLTYQMYVNTNATAFTDSTLDIEADGGATVASFAPTAVPEPASLAILGLGTLAAFRKRRKA